jgi:hypothetical protein
MIPSSANASRTKSVSKRKQSFWAPVPRKQTAKEKGKEKYNGNQGPSDALIANWRKGDEDLEPSTKMLALIELLQEWDESGDKTICYSQCKSGK